MAQGRASALDTLSCHGMHRIRRMLIRWTLSSILSYPAYVVCVSCIYVIQQCVGNTYIAECHIYELTHNTESLVADFGGRRCLCITFHDVRLIQTDDHSDVLTHLREAFHE